MKDGLQKIIICDIDGTLALLSGGDPYNLLKIEEDFLNHPIANILEVYDHQNLYDIDLIIMSGREESYRRVTEEWLARYGITHYKRLYLRKNGDKRRDAIVKKEIYEKHIKGKYDVLFVLEDRNQVVNMWRKEGLTCLQVAPGNF